MQYVNDDMDELFRRAAENYPLDTGSGDWSKVAKALQDPEENKSPQKNGKGRFLWLLLLLPLALICNPFGRNEQGENHTQSITEKNQELVNSKAADDKEQIPSAGKADENLKFNPEKSTSTTVDVVKNANVVSKSSSTISDISVNAAAANKMKQDISSAAIKTGKNSGETISGTV